MSTREFPAEIVDDTAPLQLVEVLACIRIERDALIEMVEAGVVSPSGTSVERWIFLRRDLRRLRIAQRLIAELEVNIAGAALILDLIDERDNLLRRLRATNLFDRD